MVHIRPLPADEAAAQRFAEDLWLPYHRDLEAAVESHNLVDDVPLDEEVEFRLDRLESDTYRAWVAVEGEPTDAPLAEVDRDLVGFITAEVDECPPVFDRPDRLKIGDFYVRESHRGAGLAWDLFDCAVDDAREADISELSLDADVDNERALAFYEKVGFEPHRHYMTVSVEKL
jgi:ribosomal protein S18 acetylase RimI-like enzyme